MRERKRKAKGRVREREGEEKEQRQQMPVYFAIYEKLKNEEPYTLSPSSVCGSVSLLLKKLIKGVGFCGVVHAPLH